MAAGINISLVSEVREFLKGTSDASAALDAVAGSLDDVAKEGDTTARKLARDFKDVRDDADTTSARMEREFSDAFNQVKRASRDTGRDMSGDMKKASKESVSAIEALRAEATQNFSQVASSFTGDLSSAVDMVQGTLNGLSTAIPGIGLALGGLGAVAGVFYAQWQESTERAQTRVADMYADMLASGEIYLSEAYQQQTYWDILQDQSAVLSKKKAEEYATMSGLTIQQVALAFAGNMEQMGDLEDALAAKRDEYAAASLAALGDEKVALAEHAVWYEEIIDAVQRRNAEIGKTTAEVQENQLAYKLMAAETDKAQRSEQERFAGTVDSLRMVKSDLDALPASKTITLDVDTSGIPDKIRRAMAGVTYTVPLGVAAPNRVGQAVY